jgi:dihydropteroate synthase
MMDLPSITHSTGPFEWGKRTYVMGILNITPDSFSGDGVIEEKSPGSWKQGEVTAAALDLARRFVSAGVDILDVGGESTRPGARSITSEEEIARVTPIIRALTVEMNVMISIDTYKSSVADHALKEGATMINDVWGLRADPAMADVAARGQVPLVLMHNRSSWAHADIKERLGGRYIGMAYENLVEDIKRELMESVEIARMAGVRNDNIILDPGIGFGKTVEQNLELVDRLGEFRVLGFPILLGTSRKSFIGYTLDLPPDSRMEGTAASTAVGIVRGADIIRVHDVEFMVPVARMTDAIVRR